MLRIIRGQFRGRLLEHPPASLTRPTSQRTREAIFNILRHHPDISLENARVLDACAGSGALGLEALSQGAAHVTFVESHPKVLKILRQNIQKLGVSTQTTILPLDIHKLPLSTPVDLVFMYPPYGQGLEIKALDQLKRWGWIGPATWIVLETPLKQPWILPDGFELKDQRVYGIARVTFLQRGCETNF